MSFPRYPTYKPSGVEWLGEVPEHWSLKPVFGVASERDEDNKGMKEDNLLSLSYGNIVNKDINTSDGLLPESFETYQIVRPGDIVLRLTDLQNDKRSLRSALVTQTGIITSAYLTLEPERIDSKFLNYLLRAYDVSKVFYSMGGGLRQSMKYGDIKRMPLVIPAKAEQLATATFLDHETAKIDTLIAEQQRLIELLQEKRQAVISHAVTKGLNPDTPMKDSGVEWLGEVPEHWDVAAVGHKYSVQLGKMLDSAQQTGDHSKPYLRVADVQWDSINTNDLPEMDFPPHSQERYLLKAGDLLVNEGGSYVGRAAIWEEAIEECYYQKALHRLRAYQEVRDSTHFMYWLMEYATKTGVFIAGGNQTTIDHLTAEQLRKYRFGFPSLEEQFQIADYVRLATGKLLNLTKDAENLVKILQERRSALISAAVTGQIDVRGYAPEAAVA